MIKLLNILNEIRSSKYQIYCDMDDVIVDFDKGYFDLTGINKRGQFLTGKKFWDPINKAGIKYWTDLEWTPGGKQLWNYIKKYNPIILTAPSKNKNSEHGKREWVDREISPEQHVIFKPAKEKHFYSGKNKILIDDKPETIDNWSEAGGIGILYTDTSKAISQLKKLGL